ncbi:GH25 family lysozyme M1 (1,4-beta-N-acetylmuramidase) [Murinocardiopsis flavida]|uniref:lysozyme n=1 Tax=Murinocardiopsis flavida TaxID=645275 RepID=A0A2P8CMW1_9ACTN|nr:lysozyme [Murinocardiopsis flavida]PSK86283.1 GH25 family lysozyme M1 (1,4-beta-N-acetylmuramidase) [Murinocardiopsis flavida]
MGHTSRLATAGLGLGAAFALSSALLAPAAAAAPAPTDTPAMALHAREAPDSPDRSQISAAPAGVPGIDVSHHNGSVDWGAVAKSGVKFSYIKATEGTGYKSPAFNSHYTGSHKAGLIRGAYHFARPDTSGGAAQANYFADNGGAWSADDQTLPGVLDIEDTSAAPHCYGKSPSQIVSWIKDFSDTYRKRTGRDAVIYTSAGWWNDCAGGSGAFAKTNPLWAASWNNGDKPTMPGGFPTYTFWQYTDSGSVPGIGGNTDLNVFNGSEERLLALANNT